MTFLSIYFNDNTPDYATMPYSADSCFKHIAANLKDINSFAIWRDSNETEVSTDTRIKKLKTDLKKHRPKAEIKILSTDTSQKISSLNINMSANKKQKDYLFLKLCIRYI